MTSWNFLYETNWSVIAQLNFMYVLRVWTEESQILDSIPHKWPIAQSPKHPWSTVQISSTWKKDIKTMLRYVPVSPALSRSEQRDWVWGQPGLHSDSSLKNKTKAKNTGAGNNLLVLQRTWIYFLGTCLVPRDPGSPLTFRDTRHMCGTQTYIQAKQS